MVDRTALLSRYDQYCRGGGDDSSVFFREIFSPLALEIWMRQFERYLC